jgi:hypothetical protein
MRTEKKNFLIIEKWYWKKNLKFLKINKILTKKNNIKN